MSCAVVIVGLPAAAGCAPSKTWRAAAALVGSRLAARFGSDVSFDYAELFGPEMARYGELEAAIAGGAAVPPLVAIDGEIRFAGGKLHVSAIERAVAEALAASAPIAR